MQPLDPVQSLEVFRVWLEGTKLFPPMADMNQVRTMIEITKKHGQMDYWPGTKLAVPLTLFQVEEQHLQTPADPLPNWGLGWCEHTLNDLGIVAVPGNHSSMLRPPHVRVLAEHLAARLAAAQTPPQSAD